MSNNGVRRGPNKPRTCPYCGETVTSLPYHIRTCNATPSTAEVWPR